MRVWLVRPLGNAKFDIFAATNKESIRPALGYIESTMKITQANDELIFRFEGDSTDWAVAYPIEVI